MAPKHCFHHLLVFSFYLLASIEKTATCTAESFQVSDKKPMHFVFLETVFSFRGLIYVRITWISHYIQLLPADLVHLPLNRDPCNTLTAAAPEPLPAVDATNSQQTLAFPSFPFASALNRAWGGGDQGDLALLGPSRGLTVKPDVPSTAYCCRGSTKLHEKPTASSCCRISVSPQHPLLFSPPQPLALPGGKR